MACPTAQSMLSASSCVFLRNSKPQQATLVRGGGIGIPSSSRLLTTVSCNASSSPTPTPSQDDSECNDVECAPEKEIGSLSVEWLAEERTQVVGTFPPKKKGWTGLVEKDTAGQTNIYAVEPAVYVAESAISSGTAGTSSEGSENTAALTAGLALIFVAGASSILIQVSKNQPPVQTPYSGPPLSYYVAKFQPSTAAAFSVVQSSPPVVEAPVPEETPTSDSPTLDLEAPAESSPENAEQQLSS